MVWLCRHWLVVSVDPVFLGEAIRGFSHIWMHVFYFLSDFNLIFLISPSQNLNDNLKGHDLSLTVIERNLVQKWPWPNFFVFLIQFGWVCFKWFLMKMQQNLLQAFFCSIYLFGIKGKIKKKIFDGLLIGLFPNDSS